ncbi:MAG: hypothetical protein ABH840_04725 [Nanoarchaeota archaeon]
MKKWILLVFALIILLAVAFFISENADNQFFGNSNIESNGIITQPDSSDDEIDFSDNLGNKSEINDESGSGAGGGGTGGEVLDKSNFPDDVDSVECGFYYSGYGVCSGTCPSGECVSEGRSCYCKKN